MRIAVVLLALVAAPAAAQHAHHTPYAGLEARPIKALSADLKAAEANAKKIAKEVAAEETKLKQLTAEAEKTRTVSAAVVRQSKL